MPKHTSKTKAKNEALAIAGEIRVDQGRGRRAGASPPADPPVLVAEVSADEPDPVRMSRFVTRLRAILEELDSKKESSS